MRSASTGTSSNFFPILSRISFADMVQETKRLTAHYRCMTDEHFRHYSQCHSLRYLSWNFKHSVDRFAYLHLHHCIAITSGSWRAPTSCPHCTSLRDTIVADPVFQDDTRLTRSDRPTSPACDGPYSLDSLTMNVHGTPNFIAHEMSFSFQVIESEVTDLVTSSSNLSTE